MEAYSNFLLSNGDKAVDSQTKSRYLNAHNVYVLQLHRYNNLVEDYQLNILPQWFQVKKTLTFVTKTEPINLREKRVENGTISMRQRMKADVGCGECWC